MHSEIWKKSYLALFFCGLAEYIRGIGREIGQLNADPFGHGSNTIVRSWIGSARWSEPLGSRIISVACAGDPPAHGVAFLVLRRRRLFCLSSTRLNATTYPSRSNRGKQTHVSRRGSRSPSKQRLHPRVHGRDEPSLSVVIRARVV